MSTVLFFFVTVTKRTVIESSSRLPLVGSGWSGRKMSEEQEVSEFSCHCFILKPQTSALVSPDHMYSPNASAQNIVTRYNSIH